MATIEVIMEPLLHIQDEEEMLQRYIHQEHLEEGMEKAGVIIIGLGSHTDLKVLEDHLKVHTMEEPEEVVILIAKIEITKEDRVIEAVE